MQRGQSRTAYLSAALESSIKARKCYVKKARDISEEESTNYCTNILKMITFGVILVRGGTNLQNDLEQFKENILFLSNYTLESRNF